MSRLVIVLVALVAVGCEPRAAETVAAAPSASVSEPAPSASMSASAAPSVAAIPDACADAEGVTVLISPRTPKPGQAVRAIAVTEAPLAARLTIEDDAGAVLAESDARRGGPPSFWVAAHAAAPAGRVHVHLRAPGVHACQAATVAEKGPPRAQGSWSSVWPIEAAWDAHHENLFSAWIEHLFDAPLDEQPTWKVLSEALRDPARNLLYDHLGLAEDGATTAPAIEPDCADLPYTLRAYFSFKLGLPFGYSRCSRGSSRSPPACARWSSSLTANEDNRDPVKRLGNFLRVKLANAVHSGTVRAKGDDDLGDYYPVKLTQETLRPGTVFADPYGHILIVVRRVAQTDSSGGILFAVDGQPDGTVSRRRFWRGNFLFHDDPVYGGAGFKRFRPVVFDGKRARALSNAEIAAHPSWGDFGLEQYELGIDGFYDRVDEVLSPSPMAPRQAFLETIQALEEQVRRRVLSVDNAVAYLKTHPGQIEMPTGAEIFETTGAWEDFATPSRDMRLLIAMHVVTTLPERIVARPKRWKLTEGQSLDAVKKELETLLAAETKKRKIRYTRSDGSAWELSIADVLARAKGLEVAYNPNDCPEKRWGAPPESEELSTCRRHAGRGQSALMESYRDWFATRTRPPRP